MTHPSPLAPRRPRVLVVGCGGIGGTVLGGLRQHGPEVLAEAVGLSSNAEIAAAIATHGIHLRGVGGSRKVSGTILTALGPEQAPFDWIILATQPPQVIEAATQVLPWLAPDGALVVLQNGLCELRLAARIGPERIVGAVVSWGASVLGPGVYERTSEGGFTLGTLPGVVQPRLDELDLLLEIIGPVSTTDNLAGVRWSKLALNCCISTLGTLGGDRLGPLMRHRFVRRLGLEIMSEVVSVAVAEGVALEKVAGTLDLEWLALTPAERASKGSASLVAKHALLLAVGTRYRRMRSSMLAAIERGRTPAVNYLNGEVVARGDRLGVPTPANALATAGVHAIARGEKQSGMAILRELAGELGLAVG